MIAIVDYGLGNVRAFQNVYARLNIPVAIASTAEALAGADRVIVPGVGSFDDAMGRLDRSGMRPALEELALGRRVPVLGVCVGMQMLAASSEEGRLPGLGWVPGTVRRFSGSAGGRPLWVPHMGWNGVRPVAGADLFAGLERDARFYFLHSYYFEAGPGSEVLAVAEYGLEFACAVRAGNIFGVQFHPEKSHGWGMRLLDNFARAAA